MQKIRLCLMMVFLSIFWLIYPWYTFYIYIAIISLKMINLIYLLFVTYFLLEFRLIFSYKKNEFYHFFFWFIFIVLSLLLYLITIQSFIKDPQDYLVNTSFIKIHIEYSEAFFLHMFSKNIDAMYFISVSGEIESLKDLKNSLFVMQTFYIYDLVSVIKSVKELNIFMYFCLMYTSNIMKNYDIIINYMEQENSTFITIKNLLTALITLKITCYLIPKIIIISIPKYLLSHFFNKPFRDYALQILQDTFILEMTDIEIIELCQQFEKWLLENENPFEILLEVIHYLFS